MQFFFYKEKHNKFIKFSLENGTIIHLLYDADKVSKVYTSFKRKERLFNLLTNFGYNAGYLNDVEFWRQKEEFLENNLRIEPGSYQIKGTARLKYDSVTNNFRSKESEIYEQAFTLIDLNTKNSYEITVYSNSIDITEIFFQENNKKRKEISKAELYSLSCYFIEEKRELKSINHNNAKDNIQIKEMVTDQNKEKLRKLDEVSQYKNNILVILKAEKKGKILGFVIRNFGKQQADFHFRKDHT